MRIMMDLNVIVDIAEGREGFCDKSREAFEKAVVGGVELFFPIHGFTTLHYLLAHAKKGENSKEYISWLCDRVMCAPANRAVIKAACASAVKDFEDAVVDETAFSAQCDFIVTRDTRHFEASRVKAMSPSEFIEILAQPAKRKGGDEPEPEPEPEVSAS